MSAAANAPRSARVEPGAAALWASAFVILALIVVQAGRLGGSPAAAGEVDDNAGVRLLTAESGNNEDFLAVINQRTETLSIYTVVNARSVELYDVQDLPTIFRQAGRPGAGRR